MSNSTVPANPAGRPAGNVERSRAGGLLVSVRNVDEAIVAWQEQVDIIDIKEPNNGPLGRPQVATVRQIVNRIGDAATISIALGELGETDAFDTADFLLRSDPGQRIRFVKIGHAKMASDSAWHHRWRHFVDQLPAHVTSVAVAYVDAENACSPDVMEIIAGGLHLRCGVLLLDTFDKAAGTVFEHASVPTLRRYREYANARGMELVLAGSIRMASLPMVAAVGPQLVGIRGSACRCHDRAAMIDRQQLIEFQSRLKSIVS